MRLRAGLESGLWMSAIAVTALWPCVASATLGEPESSVAAEPQQNKASIKSSDLGTYRVHLSQLPWGTVLREYAAPNGEVFAVTWRGPFVPNLKQLLGRYFDEYAAAASARRSDHRHVDVRRSDLVVQAGGHMRAMIGRAYLPQAVPSGVSVGDLE
jgi:hypothetical protein